MDVFKSTTKVMVLIRSDLKKVTAFCAMLLIITVAGFSQGLRVKNPLLSSGADPWSIYHNGFYYYTHSLGDKLAIWRTTDLSQLSTATMKIIWTPPVGKSYSKELWAPELHYLDHKWYMYFAADGGDNNHHRMYVLENSSEDPMAGTWTFKGKVSDASDKWAIDGSVFIYRDNLYMIWSGWEADDNGRQNIFIAKMINPWTIEGMRVKISGPSLEWEKHGDLHDVHNPPHVNVNEGPQILFHGNKVFLVYSASGCWTDFYALGMLTASADSDLLNPDAWTKSATPVFKTSVKNKVYAPGHNSFFTSPDGKEDWILYHANNAPGQGCGSDRSPRAQKFTWTAEGMPDFGEPVAVD